MRIRPNSTCEGGASSTLQGRPGGDARECQYSLLETVERPMWAGAHLRRAAGRMDPKHTAEGVHVDTVAGMHAGARARACTALPLQPYRLKRDLAGFRLCCTFAIMGALVGHVRAPEHA